MLKNRTAVAKPRESTEDSSASVEDVASEEVAPEDVAEAKQRRGMLRPLPLLALALVLALAGVAAYFGLQVREDRAIASARTAALDAARQYAVDLATYDHRDLAGSFKTISDNSTGQFAQQYQKVSENLTKLIQQYQATSKGTVVSASLAEGDQEKAVALLFVDQTITNTNSPQPRVDRNRMQLSLQRDQDRWRISDVQLL